MPGVVIGETPSGVIRNRLYSFSSCDVARTREAMSILSSLGITMSSTATDRSGSWILEKSGIGTVALR